MKSYGSFCPVAKTSEIFAERWTPLLLRELLIGARRFSELQNGVPLISRALLSARLRELEDAGSSRARTTRRAGGISTG
jgi:DNA-binding HxlR family transcriptional regulator